MRALFAVVAVGLATCQEQVHLTDPGRQVEVLSQAWTGKHGKKSCTKMDDFSVQALPNEVSGEGRTSVLEVKARNVAAQEDATDVLLWPSEEFHCGKDGKPDPKSKLTCQKQFVTPYQCVVGRGT